MCGILGATLNIQKEKFSKALSLINHRGPDSQDVWQDEFVTLGHTRLSIIDVLEHSNQPMHSHERFHIVFNGEIYNFLELRKELTSLGHVFKTNSDTEVLLKSYVEWGETCTAKFNGMWSFGIWDSVSKELFLSRDRMGKKPLYYFIEKNVLYFSSEQKCLLPFLEKVEVGDNFHHFTKNSYAYESGEECLFKTLKRFPAGHNGFFRCGSLSTKPFWSIFNCLEKKYPVNYDEQVEYLRELLLDSCRLRMRSDVQIGTGLSGGVDSSAIAAAVSQVTREGSESRFSSNFQNSFCASFPGTVMDESGLAETVANHLGINHNSVNIDAKTFLPDLEKICFIVEDIHEVNPIPHIALYESMRKSGVVVSLDGHGGDELFCGYESSVLNALPEAFFNKNQRRLILDTYRDLHPQNDFFRSLSPGEIGLYLLKTEGRYIRNWGVRERHRVKKSFSSLGAHLYEQSFKSVLPTLLRNYDRYSMASGVEIRMPLLDYRIVEFAFSLPWQSKLAGGYTKSILRDSISQWLPEKITHRKDKIGFAPPINSWIQGDMREYLLDELESISFKKAELVDQKGLKTSINDIISGKIAPTLYETEQVWKQFYIYLWEKVFFQKKLWRC